MGEYYWGQLSLPTKAVDEAVSELIEETGAENSWEENGLTYLEDAQARDGQFEELESYLIQQKIPFDRQSEGIGNHDAEEVFYRPGHAPAELTELSVTSGDKVRYVPTQDLQPLLDLPAEEAVKQLKDLLAKQDPPIPPLEQFA